MYRYLIIFIAVFCLTLSGSISRAQDYPSPDWVNYAYQPGSASIKSVNGKLYAHIVLLFNENPHFVNLIQKDTIPLKVIGNEGFQIKAYKNYISSIHDPALKNLANILLLIYLEPNRFTMQKLKEIELRLIRHNIILRFSRDNSIRSGGITLDYCIFGRKIPVTVNHPLLKVKEKIYNIQPFIYYDEFSTSNSTFYFDMIYINPVEVHNDYLIAKKIINGDNYSSMFFVGSRVTDDIQYCLKRAFNNTGSIKSEIKKMFVIHEITHKILNNEYNNYDQVTGEELCLLSTIYANPFLGLAVLYSYLNYNSINPHRIAATNFLKFIGIKTGNNNFIDNPGNAKYLPQDDIQNLSKELFMKKLNRLNR